MNREAQMCYVVLKLHCDATRGWKAGSSQHWGLLGVTAPQHGLMHSPILRRNRNQLIPNLVSLLPSRSQKPFVGLEVYNPHSGEN